MKTTREYTIFPCASNGGDDHRRGLDVNKKRFYFEEAREFEDVAVFHKDEYQKIFGKMRNEVTEHAKFLSVVKITYINDADKSKHSIYRRFYALNRNDLKGNVVVSIHSLLFLKNGDESLSGATVQVSRSSRFKFYWRHPNPVVRTSSRLGYISLFLGVVSVVISVL